MFRRANTPVVLRERTAPGPSPHMCVDSECLIGLGKQKKPSVCVECLIGKQKKPILFKVTEPSSIPYRAPPACAKMAAYPDPPPVIPLPESIAAQASYQLRYENTEYYSWVSSGPKCFQALVLSPSLLQNPMLG
jgi:hypothetical protein